MTDMNKELIELEYERTVVQRVDAAVLWMTMEGADNQEVQEDGFISAYFVLNGIDYFIGRPTMSVSYAFELEIGALIYENPPFSPEAIDSMLEPVVARFPIEEEILYLETSAGDVWAICRFEGADFVDSATFDTRVRQLISLAEAAHGAVR